MWLGTSERMLWVPCPAIDMPRPQERWQASGTFANGGGWVRRSAAGHRVYDLSWNLMPASEISKIRAIFDGVYGQGPFYFIDPSAERSEEHTSELQSRGHLVCRLLLEKKNLVYGA